jgi:GalNAc-alpha-(1->4)-GalNAc-alpha-(1->3)-diNAcBac-PP-undecaprenol alpha-1,4-N-acetyl-D-galactosaminyltransferase
LKIVLVISSLGQGGAERVMSELANEWSKENHEVHLVILTQQKDFYKISEKIKIYRLALPLNQNIFSRIFSLFYILRNLRNLITSINPSFVLSFMNKYNIFTIISTLGLNINIIVSERDTPTEKLHFIIDKLRKYTYKFANGVICQSKLSVDFVKNETRQKNVISIPNPLKEIIINEKIKRQKIILNVGRLVYKKGQDQLLEAFSKLNNADDWKLVLLGEGILRNVLEKKIKELKLEKKVILMGSVRNVDEWLNKSSIFVFPSLFEGFPNALAEAMGSGLACVSYDCDTGPRDIIINEENGFLVDLNDIDTLTKKVQILIDNEELRNKFSKEAIKISSTLNKEKIANDYLNFCLKVGKK